MLSSRQNAIAIDEGPSRFTIEIQGATGATGFNRIHRDSGRQLAAGGNRLQVYPTGGKEQ